MFQAEALRPVSEGFEFEFLGSSAQLAYNGGARKRGFRRERTRESERDRSLQSQRGCFLFFRPLE